MTTGNEASDWKGTEKAKERQFEVENVDDALLCFRCSEEPIWKSETKFTAELECIACGSSSGVWSNRTAALKEWNRPMLERDVLKKKAEALDQLVGAAERLPSMEGVDRTAFNVDELNAMDSFLEALSRAREASDVR